MFDHKRLFGFAAILFGIGFILQSIMPAMAISMGPNVSMGSNPVFAVHASGYSGTLFTNNTSSTAIITDLAIVTNHYCTMTFSGSNSGDSFRFRMYESGTLNVVSLNSGLKVPAGESLSFSGDSSSYCQGVSVSGYYAH
jgi:hypothetical protein